MRHTFATFATFASLAIFAGAGCGEERIEAVVVELRLSPAAFDYGSLPVGARLVRTATIVNDGNGPYAPSALPAIEVAGDVDASTFSIARQCTLPLAPGNFCEVEIAFAPKVEGRATARLVLEPPPGAAPGEVFAVDVAGIGAPAEVLVAPDAVDFGALQVGTSTRRTITVESRTDTALSLPFGFTGPGADGFRIAAVSGDASLAGTTSTTLQLEAGGTLSVDIDFAPQRGGPFEAAALVELCGIGCGPQVLLTGSGDAPRIEVEPRALDLGEVAVGSSGEGTLTVENVGAGDLVLLRLDLLTPTAELALDEADTTSLPITIAAGTSTTLTVRYAPLTARGALDATLRIQSSDPVSSDVLVTVAATAPGAALELLPRVGSFGVLDEGDERTLDVVLRSIGTVAANVESIDINGAAFGFDGAAPPLGSLLPGEALLFSVRATANATAVAAGGAEGSIVVNAGELSVPLAFFSGTAGCQPRAPAPNAALGAVVLGQGTSSSITLQNVGDGPCTLDDAVAPPGFAQAPGFRFSTARAQTIAPGASGQVDVSYDAVDTGQVSAFLSLTYEGAPAPLLVSATARGVTGTVVGEPPLLEFGPLVESCPVPSRLATFVNRGGATAEIEDVLVTHVAGPGLNGLPTPFSIVTPAFLPFPLAPGAARGITVNVASTAALGVHEAEVQVVVGEEVEATVRLRLTVEPPGTPITESFEAAEVRAVDVLFVVDNSGSMEDDQQLLAENFSRFIESAFEDTSLRFHIGVTTTDVIGGTGGPLVADYLTDSLSQASLESAFSTMAQVGIEGAGIELGLEAMRRAVDDFANTSNAGFLREDAALSIIIVSDEEDNGSLPGLDAAFVRDVETYIEVLSALKNNIANTPVLVSVVVTPGFSPRYEAVAAAFGGAVLDITTPTWGEQLSEVGTATFGLQRLFRLGSTPEPGSVTVLVDGVATTAFTVEGNAVVLDDAPDAGAVIDITYIAGCGP